MEYKILYGSKMLKLKNPRDEDLIVLQYKDPTGKHLDVLLTNEIIQSFIQGKSYVNDHPRACRLYQNSCDFHEEEDYPFEYFNILFHKRPWISFLKANINSPEQEQYIGTKQILPKRYYHILYQYYMIKENTHWISEEGRAIVQKIHDLEMPSSYFYELRDLINSLPEE